MSHPEEVESQGQFEGESEFQENDAYLDDSEIAEEVADDGNDEELVDDDMEEDPDTLEIDMSNNSWTYYDQHQDSIFTIFKHPTLPLVATGGGDNTAFLWTTHTQPPKFVGELKGHKESVVSGSFTSDGKFVISADMNGLVQVFKASKGGQKWTKFAELEEVEEVLWVAAHPTQPEYFAFGGQDASVWVYQIDPSSNSLVQIMSGFSHSLECNGGVFVDVEDKDQLSIVTISEDGTVINCNAFTGAIKWQLAPPDFKGIESPWVSIKAYKNLIAIGGRDGQLSIINNDTGRIVHSVKALEDTEDLADLSIEALSWCKSSQINLLAVGLVSGDILLFDTLQWRVRRTIKLDDTVTKLEFVDETPILIGSSMNGRIYKWDSRTGEELFVGVGHNMGILDFSVADNGKTLITAGDEGVALVFHHDS